MVVHKSSRWERSPEKLKLELEALERSGANPLLVLDDLNRAMVELLASSIKQERELSERELIQELRKALSFGRRDV